MTILIHKEGLFKAWLLPEKLYHGTTDKYLDSIMQQGLKINHEDKNSALSSPLIYLTTSIGMAKSFANSVSFRKGGNPIIIEIQSNNLLPDLLAFDLNISLRMCSQCMTYQESIKVETVMYDISEIEMGKMIFDEPKQLETPVVWDLSDSKTSEHLKNIGYQYKSIKNNC